MTACSACADFAQNPQTGSYRSGCLECAARSIAQSPMYFAARIDPHWREKYKEFVMAKLGMTYEAGHARVKHYAGLIEKAKGKS